MFYTYLWLREDGTPYYVGKGKDRRAFVSHKGHRPPNDDSRILVQEFLSEQDAFLAESLLIALYGRWDLGLGRLKNRTNGGEGAAGLPHSEQSRRKVSEHPNVRLNKGMTMPLETRQKISRTMQERTFSSEHCRRLSLAAKGKTNRWKNYRRSNDQAV
jgi:hypothetical protein